MKCESCGKTKHIYKLTGNFTWYQCWSCLELRAQEELKTDGNPFATKKEINERRDAIIETFNGKRKPTIKEIVKSGECPCVVCST